MYRTTPINRNKVLQGLQNLKFDDVENYRTHVFEKHSVMNDKENLNMVLQGNKKTQSCFIADQDRPEDTNGNVEYAKKVISNAIMDNSSRVINWLDDARNGETLELSYNAGQLVGVVFFNNKKNLIKEFSSNYAIVILERNDAMKYGFNVLTAYPVTHKGEREKTGKQLDEITRETDTYKCSDNVEKAYHIYRTDPESKLEIDCAEDRTTGDSTIFVKLKSQNPNIVSKIKISEKQYSLTTYHQEYIGTSSKPISRPIDTEYTRLSNADGGHLLSANLYKEEVFNKLKEDIPIAARDVKYIHDLITTSGESRRHMVENEKESDIEK